MKNFTEVISKIQAFQTDELGLRIAYLEGIFQNADAKNCTQFLKDFSIDEELLTNALLIKSVAGQINVIIHTLGILLSLPEILQDDEKVIDLSLGAGNTGRDFDLETDRRIAEFKFIHWRGGAESIRQNQLFKDFYELAEFSTTKEKYLYVLGLDIPMRFFKGGRALSSVFSKNNRLWQEIQDKYGNRYKTVRDYYQSKKDLVKIVDLQEISPIFSDFNLLQDLEIDY